MLLEYLENKYCFIRSLLYVFTFQGLHYLYDYLPSFATAVIGGINESVYQHSKIAFFAYLILLLIEFIIFKNKLEDKDRFLFSGLLSTILIPWIMFVFWFFLPLFYNAQIPIIVLEIVYAIGVTYLMVLAVSFLDQNLIELEYKRNMKIIILITIFLMTAQYIVFTFQLPWHDFFADPLA